MVLVTWAAKATTYILYIWMYIQQVPPPAGHMICINIVPIIPYDIQRDKKEKKTFVVLVLPP